MSSNQNVQLHTTSTHLTVPILATTVVLAATAAMATYLVIQLIQGGHLLTFPGIGVTPYNLTLCTTVGFYGVTGLLMISTAVMIRNVLKAPGSNSCFEGLRFLGRFIMHPTQVGAIAPSSHALAVQITDPVPDRSQIATSELGQRFLEIGAGTGVFTREIVKKLGPNDHLDVVEYDHDFCELLRNEFSANTSVTIHEISITDFQPNYQYDVIVSGLPLNAFESDFVEQVLAKYEALSKPDGVVSYFEYIALEKIKKAFLFGTSHRQFSQVLDQKASFVTKHAATHSNVLGNFPPARVQRCTIRKETA